MKLAQTIFSVALLISLSLYNIHFCSTILRPYTESFSRTEKSARDDNSILLSIPNEPMTWLDGYLEAAITTETNETSPLQDCSPTAQIKIKMAQDKWILQTFDHFGEEKNIGGDEMYITYTDSHSMAKDGDREGPPTGVAFIEDLDDGTYLLDFSTTPMNANVTNLSGTGMLIVYFEYTCGIGMLPQPTKLHWKNSGSSSQIGVALNVPEPAIKKFQHPQLPEFGHWPLVVFFGDSTMLGMIANYKKRANKFLRPNVHFAKNPRSFLSMETVNHISNLFEKWHRNQILKYNSAVPVVIGSAIWDVLVRENIQGVDFKDHLTACRYFIEKIRDNYPGITLYWKSPSSLHMHRVNCTLANYALQMCVDSIRYLSNSRVRTLHYKQKALMNELNVTYLDLFDSYYLSAYYTFDGDGRHFEYELNEVILDWFYPHNKTLQSV